MSNLIKSTHYISAQDLKYVESTRFYGNPNNEDSVIVDDSEIAKRREDEYEKMRRQIMDEAAVVAEEEVRHATEEAARILEAAKAEAEAWWEQRRQDDEQLIEMSKLDGFERGYQEGVEQAQEATRQQVEQMLHEAKVILEQAYTAKEQIVQEAEPFLVDLSCAIAEKIVDKQLSVEQDYAIELVRRQLSRKREQGTITLCVAPEHFAFVQAVREELALSIDSQAELQILPDSTISDWGCVIRSSYGSIDARIDTQLTEIKKHLLQIAMYQEDQNVEGEHA
ncbi:flagellar assembly protein FliH [Paenibacillus selenitireducens]|uniref:Flagellar assembly protein FliH n=1 Tax=Paenibacillus selenitireducens TaxID=1324314 RepID=A0A1T2XCF4_9BACL|nr:FliH/SctL family protein [Paenibacillus selenitireducens]OPA77594.1 flagellar assembly protein FliH [Paenibacillus selenitireducens]